MGSLLIHWCDECGKRFESGEDPELPWGLNLHPPEPECWTAWDFCSLACLVDFAARGEEALRARAREENARKTGEDAASR